MQLTSDRHRSFVLAVFMLLAAVAFGGASQASSITYNGEAVYDIVDDGFLPIEVSDDGTFSRIYRNMTDDVIDVLRFFFLPPLAKDPDVRGGSVLTATVNEVAYKDLGIVPKQLFRIRMSGLVPQSRFAITSNENAILTPQDIKRIFQRFDSPNRVARAVPLPLPVLLLAAALVVLAGIRYGAGRAVA